ncbi:MAG: DUF5652 family protein [Candidatus Saccharibacteria bacterium]
MDYNLTVTQAVLIIILILWEITWKGFALWRASHNNQLEWFISILVINSLGILPILYLILHPKNHKLKTSQLK